MNNDAIAKIITFNTCVLITIITLMFMLNKCSIEKKISKYHEEVISKCN